MFAFFLGCTNSKITSTLNWRSIRRGRNLSPLKIKALILIFFINYLRRQNTQKELAKYESWEDVKTDNKFITHLFENVSSFMNCKRIDPKTKEMVGVGQTTILKFLGRNLALLKIKVLFKNILNLTR